MQRRFFLLLAVAIMLASVPLVAQEKSAAPEIVHKLKGHTDAVYAAAYSPDGKFIATASFDNTLKLWDAATGKEIKTYGGTGGHTKQVVALAFNQDGSSLASGSTDNTVKTWDVPVNAPIRSFKSNDAVNAVALSPDGLKLAIGGKDGWLKLVNPVDFKELVKLEAGHQGAITSLSFSGNNATFASVGADRTLRYWNVADGKLLANVGAHTSGVNNVVVNPNNTAAYTVGDDGFLKFWQMPPPATQKPIPVASTTRALALTPDNASFYVAGDDRNVRQFSVANPKELRVLSGPQANVTTVATHPQNTFIGAGTADSKVYLWNNSDPKTPISWLAHANGVQSVQMQAPTVLMSSGGDGLVKFWNLPQLAPKTMTHPDAVLAAVTSPDGKKLFTGSADKIVRIWDTAKQAAEKQFAGHTAPVTAIAVSANLAVLASGSADNTIRLWNQATAKESDVLMAHAAPLTALGINAAGTQLLSAGEDGAVKLWALPLVAPKQLALPDAAVKMIVTNDGAKMLTAGSDKLIRLWILATGANERNFTGLTQPITSIAISSNSATVAATSADKTLTLWNATDAKQLHKLPLPAEPRAVAFAIDAQSVFVGLADGAIKQIKVADGKEMKPLPQQQPILGLVSAPKGDLLYSASDNSITALGLPDGAPKLKFDHTAAITSVALSKDGAKLAALADKSLKIWNAADAKELITIKLPADAKEISLSPDGARVIVAGVDKLARIYDVTGALLELLPHDGPVQGVAFFDAKKTVTASDKLARQWTSSLVWSRTHAGPVRQALFTPKGDQILSAGDDKSIKLWNAADGKEVKSLTNDSPITHLSLNADATKFATAGADKNVKIWTLADGKSTPPLVQASPVQSLSLSPNGQRLAIATQDGAKNFVRIHDVPFGKDVQTFEDHTAALKVVQYLADNRTLMTASADKTAKLLDANIATVLPAHPPGATFAQYNALGTQLVTAGADKTVKVWDIAKSNLLKSFGPVADPITGVAFNKDFTRVGAISGKHVIVWTVADGKEVARFTHAADVQAFAFTPENTRVVTGATDKQTRLWDLATSKELQFFAQDDAVTAVAALPNNVVLSTSGKTARLDTASILRAISVDSGPTHALAIVPANTHVLTGGTDKVVKLWNLANGNKERDFPGATAPIKTVAISKNALLLAAGGTDGVLRTYQFGDAKEIGSVKINSELKALAFTANNLALVASTSNKSLSAWSVPFTAGQPLAKDYLAPVQSWQTPDVLADFTIAADNTSIYSAGLDKAMHVWKLASPAPTRNFPYGVGVDAVAFPPNSSLLAAAGHDGKVRYFDLVKNAPAKEISAHIQMVQKNNVPRAIYSLTFTSDGKQVLTSSEDYSLKLWDVGSGNLVKEFKSYKEKEFEKGHQEPVYTAAFSLDGKFIASGSSGLERTIKIWSLDGNVVRDLENPAFKTTPFPPASHPGAVSALRFTKDGKRLISVGDAPGNKGYLAIWDWQAGKLLHESTSHLGVFYGLALAPDELTLVITAGNRDRKGASPDFNSAYVIKMPTVK